MLCSKRLFKLHWRRTGLYVLIFVYMFLLLFALFNKTSRVVYNMPYNIGQKDISNLCSLDITELGLVQVDMKIPNEKQLDTLKKSVLHGGCWKPINCTSVQNIAIIIPHRDRETHLMRLLNRLHVLLQIQKLQYHIFVIDQAGTQSFNRGRLLNVGVVEALKVAQFDCFIFHDVDLIPEHDGNLYMCDNQLRHLASAIDEMRYHVMYNNYAGGVVAVNYENLKAINGHSNDFWGWGSEDDDFSARSIGAGLLLTRPPEHLGRYKMVKHIKEWRSNNGYEMFLTWRSRWKSDGLHNVQHKYKLISVKKHALYTNVSVGLGQEQPLQYEHLPRESMLWFLWFFFP